MFCSMGLNYRATQFLEYMNIFLYKEAHIYYFNLNIMQIKLLKYVILKELLHNDL